LAKGYKVLNASHSAPSDSIIRYVKDAQLDAILISVTLLENMGSAERLIRTIRAASNIPILIGGQALLKVTYERRNIIISSKVQIMKKVQLNEVLRVIGQVTRQRK
jgi:cobalamin-dependent methionine synthase I